MFCFRVSSVFQSFLPHFSDYSSACEVNECFILFLFYCYFVFCLVNKVSRVAVETLFCGSS